MPALLLACAGLLGAALGAVPALELGLVAEGRYRTTEAGGSPPQRTAEAEVTPRLRVGLGWSAVDVAAEYRPVLTMADTGGGTRALLHQATLLGRWQPQADWLASAQADGRLGELSRLQLAASGVAGGGAAQLVPTLGSIGYRSLEGTLGFGASTGPRHRLLGTLSGAEEGGATLADQRWLPRQRRLHATAGLEWEAGPHDVLATTADLNLSEFSAGPSASVALLQEAWRRIHSASLRLWLAGGPALATQRAGGVMTTHLRPSAEAGVVYDGRLAGRPATGRLVLLLAPAVDRVTGAVPQRVGLTAGLVFLPVRAWRLEGTASAGRVLEGLQEADEAWAATAQVGRSLGEFVELSVGARALLQRQPRYLITTLDWQGFLALEIHARRPDRVVPDPSAVKDPLRPAPPESPEEHP